MNQQYSYQRIFDLLPNFTARFNKSDAFARKDKREWHYVSAGQFIQQVNELSIGLLKMGIQKGDKIAIIAEGCPEWNIVDFGIQQTGAVSVPLYPTITVEDYRYIFQDSEVKLVFVGDESLLKKAIEAAKDAPSVNQIYTFEKINGANHWSEILQSIDNQSIKDLEIAKSEVQHNDLLTIIYTSGTTGKPKGVMLSHRNLISNIEACSSYFPFDENCRALSFLPLNHVYERMVLYLYMRLGISIYYAQNIATIAEDLRDVRPQIFTTVPRLLEKVYDKIVAKGYEQTGWKRRIFLWALGVGLQYDPNKKYGWWYKKQLELANKLVFSKWREALGDNLRMVNSGAAALQARLARVFWAAGIPITEGYGMTESSPVIAVNRISPLDLRIGTVGPVIDGITVKIAEDGEILVKGPNVMMGYYNQPELTKEVIDEEGWLHTGDIGMLEEGRYLKITDRKKEIFKTSGGKYIAPQMIENKLKESGFIEMVMVVGEGQKFPAALVIPEFSALRDWAKTQGIAYTSDQEMIDNEDVIKKMYDEVKILNNDFAQYERVKKIKLLSNPWTVEGGEITPTLKPKRKVILNKYKEEIEGMFE
jgi:long-chain acyl-CoA synthetase